ncbi:hypothetical protein FNU79_17745 [Deinococcus detaillensis]|uniref:Uncharacterized protein n=1 Tax=Deinococcus detaillensis TaxID=2592048 RepID=A0A553UH33_9DEIO|nr:hypothetical protein [Deinococcus detaillensis]TSA79534.1 hypothetical protein FNU79_17745 [Deinococcus detaillensis]
MKLLRLSEQMSKAKDPAKYYRAFEAAVVRNEIVGVVELSERARIPARKKGGKAREVSDYAIMPSEAFNAWNEHALLLATSSTNVPSFNALQSGVINFEEAERATRKMLEKKAQRAAALVAERKAKLSRTQQK